MKGRNTSFLTSALVFTLLISMLTTDVLLGADVAGRENTSGIFFSESFDDPNLTGRGWYDGNKFRISEKDVYAGKGCIEYRWDKNGTRPVLSAGIRRLFEPTEVVYLRFYIKLSDGWGWSGRSYHPHMMHFLTTENSKYHGPAASHLTLYIEPVNGRLRLAATDIQNKDAPHGLTQGPLRGGYNGRHCDSEDMLFDDAKWHCVEAMFKLNSLDMKNDKPNNDGRLRGWFDGKLVVERNDVVFRSTDFPEMKFNQFLLMPYFGRGLLPHEQTLWIDELIVGTQRIGRIKHPSQGQNARMFSSGVAGGTSQPGIKTNLYPPVSRHSPAAAATSSGLPSNRTPAGLKFPHNVIWGPTVSLASASGTIQSTSIISAPLFAMCCTIFDMLPQMCNFTAAPAS